MAQFVVNGVAAGALTAMVALSMALIYLPTRFFHFAHAAVITWGAYLCYSAVALLAMPLGIAVAMAVVGSAIIGAILEISVYRPLRRRGSGRLVLLLASLGLYIVLQNAISAFYGDAARSLNVSWAVQSVPLLGTRVALTQVYAVSVSAFIFLLAVALLRYSRFGQQLRAVASDWELAQVAGIEPNRVVLAAFAIGSAVAGLAGLLAALDTDAVPTMGLGALMLGVVAMIIGGVNSVVGILAGGLALGVLQNLVIWGVGSQWQDATTFAILIIFLALRPTGIFGRISSRGAA